MKKRLKAELKAKLMVELIDSGHCPINIISKMVNGKVEKWLVAEDLPGNSNDRILEVGPLPEELPEHIKAEDETLKNCDKTIVKPLDK